MRKNFICFTTTICLLALISCKKDDGGIASNNNPKAPVANAGQDITIKLPVSSTILDASASKDPDLNIVSYNWRSISGPATVTLTATNATTASVSGMIDPGLYQYELTVKDADNLSSKDTVMVAVAQPNCTAQPNKEIAYQNLAWDKAWLQVIYIQNPFSLMPPNSTIKNVYIKRDGSSTWDLAVPLAIDLSVFGKYYEWDLSTSNVLSVYPGSNRIDDTPDIKIEYCN